MGLTLLVGAISFLREQLWKVGDCLKIFDQMGLVEITVFLAANSRFNVQMPPS